MSAFSYSWDVRRFAFDMSFSDKIPSAASFQSQVIKPCVVEPSASHSFNARTILCDAISREETLVVRTPIRL